MACEDDPVQGRVLRLKEANNATSVNFIIGDNYSGVANPNDNPWDRYQTEYNFKFKDNSNGTTPLRFTFLVKSTDGNRYAIPYTYDSIIGGQACGLTLSSSYRDGQWHDFYHVVSGEDLDYILDDSYGGSLETVYGMIVTAEDVSIDVMGIKM